MATKMVTSVSRWFYGDKTGLLLFLSYSFKKFRELLSLFKISDPTRVYLHMRFLKDNFFESLCSVIFSPAYGCLYSEGMALKLSPTRKIDNTKEAWKLAVRITDLFWVQRNIEMIILDEKGDKITAAIPNLKVQTWKEKLKDGKTYKVQNFDVKEMRERTRIATILTKNCYRKKIFLLFQCICSNLLLSKIFSVDLLLLTY